MTRTSLLLATCCLAALSAAVKAAPRRVPGNDEARRLAADDFGTRRAAARSLAATPDAALLPWLMQVAQSRDAEASLAAVRILERWLTSAPLPISEEVEERLDELSRDAATGVRRAAGDALVVHRKLRQQRAVAALRALGAKVDFGPDHDALQIAYNVTHEEVDSRDRRLAVAAVINATHPPDDVLRDDVLRDDELYDAGERGPVISRDSLPQIPRQVFLTSQWTGGDAGTRHLRRLAGIDALLVYVVSGCQTEFTSVLQATAELPDAAVQERGPCLGVSNSRMGPEAIVGDTLAGGAAEAAGIEPLDLIVAVKGRREDSASQRVDSFGGLIQEVARFAPGETIDLTIVRGLEPMVIPVTLGNWIEADTQSQLWKLSDDIGWALPPQRLLFPMNPPAVPPLMLPQLLPPNLPIQPLDPLPPRIEEK